MSKYEMSTGVFNRLKEFTIKQSCVDDEEITRDTQIEDHLGVTGDDAVDFLVAYSKEFNVDITKFMAADYFDSEGGFGLFEIVRGLFGQGRTRKVLTVGDLEKGIYAGRLDEEVINH